MIEIFIGAALVASLGANGVFLRKRAKEKKITDPNHQLIMVFSDKVHNGHTYHGWHYACACGAFGHAVNNNQNYTYMAKGNEAGAMKAWHNHALLHQKLMTGEVPEVVRLREVLEAERKECICKELTSGDGRRILEV